VSEAQGHLSVRSSTEGILVAKGWKIFENPTALRGCPMRRLSYSLPSAKKVRDGPSTAAKFCRSLPWHLAGLSVQGAGLDEGKRQGGPGD
jgi:hypothetical protein